MHTVGASRPHAGMPPGIEPKDWTTVQLTRPTGGDVLGGGLDRATIADRDDLAVTHGVDEELGPGTSDGVDDIRALDLGHPRGREGQRLAQSALKGQDALQGVGDRHPHDALLASLGKHPGDAGA